MPVTMPIVEAIRYLRSRAASRCDGKAIGWSLTDVTAIRVVLDALDASELPKEQQRRAETEQLLAEAFADRERRLATRHGRFLMWLLRKTT